MIYHRFRLRYVEATESTPAEVIIAPKANTRKVLASAPSIAAAIDLIRVWESQLDLFAGSAHDFTRDAGAAHLPDLGSPVHGRVARAPSAGRARDHARAAGQD